MPDRGPRAATSASRSSATPPSSSGTARGPRAEALCPQHRAERPEIAGMPTVSCICGRIIAAPAPTMSRPPPPTRCPSATPIPALQLALTAAAIWRSRRTPSATHSADGRPGRLHRSAATRSLRMTRISTAASAASIASIIRLITMFALARDVDQRSLADYGGRRDHFGRQQEGEHSGAAGEAGADQPHHRLARDAERKGDAELRGDDPVGHLPHLLGDRGTCRRPRCCRAMAGPRIGSKLVFSLAGRVRPAARHNKCRRRSPGTNTPSTARSIRRDAHSTASAAASGTLRTAFPMRRRGPASIRAAGHSIATSGISAATSAADHRHHVGDDQPVTQRHERTRPRPRC